MYVMHAQINPKLKEQISQDINLYSQFDVR